MSAMCLQILWRQAVRESSLVQISTVAVQMHRPQDLLSRNRTIPKVFHEPCHSVQTTKSKQTGDRTDCQSNVNNDLFFLINVSYPCKIHVIGIVILWFKILRSDIYLDFSKRISTYIVSHFLNKILYTLSLLFHINYLSPRL